MGKPAVREGDPCKCIAHFDFAALAAPPPRMVRVNGKAIVVQSDTCGCKAGPALVSLGSGTVRVNGLGPARVGELSIAAGGHAGAFTGGSTNVRIGGPAVVGPIARFLRICAGLPAGRSEGRVSQGFTREYYDWWKKQPGSVPLIPDGEQLQKQSLANCGPETARQIVQAHGASQGDARRATLGESEIYETAISEGLATESPEPREDATDADPPGRPAGITKYVKGKGGGGGVRQDGFIRLLNLYGVDNERLRWDKNVIASAIGEGRPTALLLRNPYDGSGAPDANRRHVVLAIGAELDDAGNVIAFYINDTGTGTCGTRVDADLVMAAKDPMGGGSTARADVVIARLQSSLGFGLVRVLRLARACARWVCSPRTPGEQQARFLCAAVVLAGVVGSLVTLTPARRLPAPPGAELGLIRIGPTSISYEAERAAERMGHEAVNGQVIHVLAGERLAFEIQIAAKGPAPPRCHVTILELGVDLTVSSGDEIAFQTTGTTPSELVVSGEACPIDSSIGIVPLERLDYSHWASTTSAMLSAPPYSVELDDAVDVGGRLAQWHCASCHSTDGSSPSREGAGPTLVNLCGARVPNRRWRVADRTYLHAKIELGRSLGLDWTSDPPAAEDVFWHRFGRALDERQVAAIVTYLESLSERCGAPPRAPPRDRSGPRSIIGRYCAPCHLDTGEAASSPPFLGMFGSLVPTSDGFARRVDAAFVRERLLPGAKVLLDVRYPPAASHDFAGRLSERNIERLVDELRAIGVRAADEVRAASGRRDPMR